MDCYDRMGRPISTLEYAALFSNSLYKGLAKDQVGDLLVSTVWLGLDHAFGGEGPPMIFETMVLNPDYSDIYCERYGTEDEALAGHKRILRDVRAGSISP